MIRRLNKLVVCLLPMFCCALTSCKDTREKVMRDALDMCEQRIEILEDYASGRVSEDETVNNLDKLSAIAINLKERMDEIMEREAEQGMRDPEITGKMEELLGDLMSMWARMNALESALKKSGKWTPAIEKVMQSP